MPSRSIVARTCSEPGVMLRTGLSRFAICSSSWWIPEETLGLDSSIKRLLGEVGGAGHVFVAAVGAGTDHANL